MLFGVLRWDYHRSCMFVFPSLCPFWGWLSNNTVLIGTDTESPPWPPGCTDSVLGLRPSQLDLDHPEQCPDEASTINEPCESPKQNNTKHVVSRSLSPNLTFLFTTCVIDYIIIPARDPTQHIIYMCMRLYTLICVCMCICVMMCLISNLMRFILVLMRVVSLEWISMCLIFVSFTFHQNKSKGRNLFLGFRHLARHPVLASKPTDAHCHTIQKESWAHLKLQSESRFIGTSVQICANLMKLRDDVFVGIRHLVVEKARHSVACQCVL